MTRQRLYRHGIAYRHARQQSSTRAYAAFGLRPPRSSSRARGPAACVPPHARHGRAKNTRRLHRAWLPGYHPSGPTPPRPACGEVGGATERAQQRRGARAA
eukprot:scaffold25003_cov57-Phaeocystis_antarctica.AAC.4